MSMQFVGDRRRLILLTLVAALAFPGMALAQQHGGHSSGGGFHGGFHGGSAFHGTPAFHGGGAAAVRGGAYHRSYVGPTHSYAYGHGIGRPYYGRGYYRGGYGYRGWYGGLALGAFVATLPLYYDTYWWGGVPYYYRDNVYYRWDDGVGEYQVVAPPDNVNAPSSSQAPVGELYAYPKSGQSAEQQKTDRYECHSWAVGQTGFDPTAGAAADDAKRSDYLRAEGACLTGRGYSVQ